MKSKKIISMLLAVIMLLGTLPLSAFASDWGEGDTLEEALSEFKVASHDNLLDWLTLPGLGVINQRYSYFLFMNERTGTIDEHPVYCIDPTKGGAYEIVKNIGPNDDGSNTATYIRSERVGDTRYLSILASGYPHNKYTSLGLQSDEEGYYATKVALWMYIRGNDATKLAINPKYGASDPVALRVYNAAISIYNNGMKGSGILNDPSIKMSGKPTAVATLDAAGEYYVQVIDILASGWVGTDGSGSGPIQLSWGSAPPEGTIVLGSSGEDITSTLSVTTKSDNGWRGTATVKYPAANIDPDTFVPPTIYAEAIVPNNEVFIAYAKAGQSTYQRYLVERDPKAPAKASFTSQIYSVPDEDIPDGTTLRIRKVQTGTNTPLAGAIFEVKDPDGKVIYSGATPDTGVIDLPLAVVGNYTVTEKTPPQYHLPAAIQTQSITVKYNELSEVTFANDPYGTLRVLKRDASNGAPLSGATIQIKHIKTGATYSATTDSSGNVVFDNLPVGAYAIVELSAPVGYELDSSTHTVNVTSLKDGEVSYSLTNKAKAGLRIYKFDKQTMTPIAGVTFEIWKDGELYGTYVTDSWGEITLTNLPSGTYTAKEVSTIEPYVLDPTVQWIEITAGQGHISELVFLNLIKPGIRLVKLDSETLAPLPNARYEIAHVGGSYKNEFVTDQNGEIDLSGLEPGAYTVKELAAPSGYLIDDNIRIVQINAGENAQFVFTDTRKPTMEIIKYDSQNGTFVPGATIRIAKIEDGTHYLDRITDINGKITISDLEPGVYSVQEISAPGGYILNDREYHVELFPGRTSQLVIENVKKPSLIIWKYDMQTAEPLPDAEFSIAKKGGSVIYEGVTNGDGYIRLDNLDEGWYTITELAPPPGYLAVTESKDVYLEGGKTIEIKFDNLKCPTLTINKIDSITKDGLANVRFNVKFSPNVNFTGGVIDLGDFTTDESGQIIMDDNLQAGWYRVTELAAPAGYIIADPATQDIFLAGGENKTLTFENIPKSAIIIRKVDSDTGLPVQGATFEVRYLSGISGSGGTLIKNVVTSVNGTATITGLAPGTYVVEETVPANGYELSNPSVQTAYITDNEQAVVELVFSNAKKGEVLIQKLDSVTGQPLKGAQFKVTDSSGAVIGPNNGIYTTDASGLINLTEYLSVGSTIVVQETKAPDGYILDTTAQTLKIKENTTHTLTFYNSPKGSLIIEKRDSVTKKPLAGAEFKITNSSGEYVAQSGGAISSNGIYTTDANGQIHITLLEEDTYVVTETKAPDGYNLDAPSQTVKVNPNDTQTLTFYDSPKSGLQIVKIDSVTKQPIKGAEFTVYKKSGDLIGTYETDKDGLIIIDKLDSGWIKIVETKAPDGYILDDTPKDVEITSNQFVKVTFENVPQGGLQIIKLDEETRRPISGVEFAVAKQNGERIGTYRTDSQGIIRIPDLPKGWYVVSEVKSASGYLLDAKDHSIEVKDGGTAVLTVTNRKSSAILIHKIDSVTGKGIYGVSFLISDGNSNPLITVTSDQNGYVYVPDLPDGKYYVREIEAAKGYILDTGTKTFYIRYGSTSEIEWKNTPEMGQIQITKKSADDNPINGFPAGTLLADAVFEIYDRSGNKVDTIRTDKNGWAATKTLPIGRYTIREVQAPAYYSAVKGTIDAEIEFSGQIVRLEVLNTSVYTNVSITKRGYTEVVPGQTIRYDFKNIGNNSTVPLDSFYWRDTLPTDAVRLDKIVTGTWTNQLSYKIVFKTNVNSEYRTLADNLSTSKVYTLDASAAALGLASNEYVTEFMVIFGRVPAGFKQVEAPYIYCTVLKGLAHEYRFTNKCDVGGLWGSQWIMANDRWVTVTYSKTTPPSLPRTGY